MASRTFVKLPVRGQRQARRAAERRIAEEEARGTCEPVEPIVLVSPDSRQQEVDDE